jgi:mevalonate kinase
MGQKKLDSFPSKILLFGEYLVLKGGQAISIPYKKFSLQKTFVEKSNKAYLIKFFEFISSNEIFKNRISEQLKVDIENGLHFESNIPVGYGLGSSGAIVALIYDHYILEKKNEFLEVKFELGQLENFFHNNSSGVDPLTSYIQMPIHISSDESSILCHEISLASFYLHDSGIKRNAKVAIDHFVNLSRAELFQNELMKLSILNNSIIQNIIDQKSILSQMQQFSKIQLELFSDFIPEPTKKLWEYGIHSETYWMKLCGAGMGGMFLVYSETPQDLFESIMD